jgi:Holliday junction resolvase-like predicted endonuclease
MPIMARRAEPLGPPKSAPRPERVAAFRLGLSAESRAAMLLIAKGHRIAARRWKTPVGEIDIVARRRRDLVFVEVKARDDLDAAAEAVTERATHRRRRRILAFKPSRRRAMLHPLRRHPGGAGQAAAAHRQCVRCQPLNL